MFFNQIFRSFTHLLHVKFIVLLTISTSYGQNGLIHEREFQHDGTVRNYLLYVPAQYDGTEKWPLVINYHGYSGNPMIQIDATQMNVAADLMNFIIAYPEGLEVDLGLAKGTGWNLGSLSQYNDIDFSVKLLDHVSSDHLIDSGRIHLAGWSQGGAFVYTMACAQSSIIASIASVAGPMQTYQLNPDNPMACSPERPLPTLQVHGTADPMVPFEGGWNWSSAFDTANFWANLNNCEANPSSVELEDVATDDNSSVTLFSYGNCNRQSEILLFRINDGDHMWPGAGVFQGDFDMSHWNRDLNASLEILNFFERQRLDDPKTLIQKTTWGVLKSNANE